MRFLIGIITGAILTLFIATSLDAPTHPTLELARTQIERLWDALIDTTSDSLFKVEEARSPAGKAPVSSQDATSADGPTPWASEQPDLPESHHGAPDTPVTALEAPEQLPPPPPAQVSRMDSVAEEDYDHPAPAPVSIIENPDYALPPMELAAVWVPFHSQMSAEGFAARLSRELDHSFRVERQGAGAYQVVFDATSPIQRDTLLTQIAEITGQ